MKLCFTSAFTVIYIKFKEQAPALKTYIKFGQLAEYDILKAKYSFNSYLNYSVKVDKVVHFVGWFCYQQQAQNRLQKIELNVSSIITNYSKIF